MTLLVQFIKHLSCPKGKPSISLKLTAARKVLWNFINVLRTSTTTLSLSRLWSIWQRIMGQDIFWSFLIEFHNFELHKYRGQSQGILFFWRQGILNKQGAISKQDLFPILYGSHWLAQFQCFCSIENVAYSSPTYLQLYLHSSFNVLS